MPRRRLRAGDPGIDAPLDTDDTEITFDTEPPRPATLGHTSLHRLNRRELDRTLRDLRGVDTTPWPASSPTTSPSSSTTTPPCSPCRRCSPTSTCARSRTWCTPPSSVTLSGWRTDSNPLRFELLVNDAVVATFATPGPPRDTPLPFSPDVELSPGTHTLAVRFLDAPGVDALGLSRALDIDHLAVVGPYAASNPLRDRHLSCTPIGWTPDVADGGATDWRPSRELPEPVCTRRVLSEFLRRAWRRTVTAEEIDRLQARVDAKRAWARPGPIPSPTSTRCCGPRWGRRCGRSSPPSSTPSEA